MQAILHPPCYWITLVLLTRITNTSLSKQRSANFITSTYESIPIPKLILRTVRKTNAQRSQGKTVGNRQITIICTVKIRVHAHHTPTGALDDSYEAKLKHQRYTTPF